MGHRTGIYETEASHEKVVQGNKVPKTLGRAICSPVPCRAKFFRLDRTRVDDPCSPSCFVGEVGPR